MFGGNGISGEHVMIEFKGSHFEWDVILWAVRWYVAYPISYRQLEEMMEEHGVAVDHACRADRNCATRIRGKRPFSAIGKCAQLTVILQQISG
jgi:hypothetical protein